MSSLAKFDKMMQKQFSGGSLFKKCSGTTVFLLENANYLRPRPHTLDKNEFIMDQEYKCEK